jgi:CubicO group peptidase (beta-lactamase class C family)
MAHAELCRMMRLFVHAGMLINGGTGANGARILGPKTISLMFKNHLPGGKSVPQMENSGAQTALVLQTVHVPNSVMASVHVTYKSHDIMFAANSITFRLMSDSLPLEGMGYGLGGIVPIGDSHPVQDGCLAMPEGSYSWAGIAGTDVIIDPANDLAILFMTQILFSGFNTGVNSMAGTGKHAHFVMAALDQ